MRARGPRPGRALLGRRAALATVAPAPARPPATRAVGRTPRRADPPPWRLLGGLALVAYVPLLLTRRGWVSADTKTYLYLDPSRLMGRAWSMWDPSIGLGTVTHQNIGFLWPMGPFYWLADVLGVPDWAAQRLWWGTIVFAAGAGVAYLLRTLGWGRGPGVTVATFTYALTPYLLTLIARLSAILLPFAALPWLVALAARTVRTRGWRYPALFALVVATCGSVNATALLLVGLAPVLWLAHAVWVAGEVPPRTAVRAALRIGVATVPVSAWWIAGLSVQGTNGIEILRYTETARTVAAVSVSHEVLRGLGYWFFYGGDRLGPWIEPSVDYTQRVPLLVVTYLVPLLGLVGGVVARWRHRAYFVMLVAVGVALAVGAYPWEGGAPFPRAVRAFLESDLGLSMRSLPRAVPLVALGLAVLAGAGVTSATRRWPRLSPALPAAVVAVALLALPPLWRGELVPDNLRRPEELPTYWDEAAAHLDARGDGTRVLVVPGSDFASYRWGNTVDPVLPGLMDRPSVQRELIPYGSAPSANLLNAFDLTLQERTAEPQGIAPLARLMRAGDVLVQSDLQYERYNTPRPRNLWQLVTAAPGLGEPTGFGPTAPNVTVDEVQLDDELMLQTPPDLPDPPSLASFGVEDPVPIVSTHATASPLLVAGDGAGLVDAAAAGLVDGRELIRYSASMSEGEIDAALDDGATLVVTDSNRDRGERWTTVRHTRGYTEAPGEEPLEEDPTDNRLPTFPDASEDAMTVSAPTGGITARATSYGNPITFTTEERPALAVDGDVETAWRTAAFSDARGERLALSLDDPVTTDTITLTQATNGSRNRFITEVRLRFDGGDPVDVALGSESRDEPGQRVRFPERTFDELSIEILADTAGVRSRYTGQSSVGFAEVAIGDRPPTQVERVRLPVDLLDAVGRADLDHPLAVVVTRQRQDPTETTRHDEEAAMARVVELPSPRSFRLDGEVRLFRRDPASVIDQVLGRRHDGTVTWARASSRLTGDVHTASAAFDGDRSTAWTSLRSAPRRQWVEVNLAAPVTVDAVPLTLVADGRHSVPTEVEVWVDGEVVGRVPLSPVADGDRQGSVRDVEARLPRAVTGSSFRFRFTDVRPVTTNDWVSESRIEQPLAVAEVGLPGPHVPPLAPAFDSGCRRDLVRADGRPVPVRVRGRTADLLAGEALPLVACDGAPLALARGRHEVTTAPGRSTGLDVDRLVIRSAAGGAADRAGGLLAAGRPGAGAVPTVEVTADEHDHATARITGATPGEPFWLVLGQSHNPGWTATAGHDELGEPVLVDGFANGWLVTPTAGSFDVDLRFAPQRRVDVAMVISLVAAVVCLGLALRRPTPAVRAPSSLAEPYSPVLAFRYDGALPTRRRAVLTGVAVGLGALALAGPAVGVVVGAAAGIGCRHEAFRRYLLLASPLALAACAAYVVDVQVRQSPEPSFDWPVEISAVHPLGWLAVLLLVADVIVDRVWRARRSDRD
ncbi:MAG TPA: alpha-(1-_3)-arabinofuranosyltransferase family protein [Acidimicrobiales bacterium]|nr:alpha-(1->3)-arabinofuranosyltransferase family protein [Acidimicrobiales bacterium]